MHILRWIFFTMITPGLLGLIAASLDSFVCHTDLLGPFWFSFLGTYVLIFWFWIAPWLERLKKTPLK